MRSRSSTIFLMWSMTFSRCCPRPGGSSMVVGSGALGKFWRRALEGDFKRFGDRVTFVWSNELSLQDIQRRVATLPAHSAIFYFTFGTDAQGGAYADEQVLTDLHAKANAPMFGGLSSLFGHGIVGGSMMSIDDVLCAQYGRRGQSNPEWRAARKPQSAAATAGPAAIRLARIATLGNTRIAASAWCRGVLSLTRHLGRLPLAYRRDNRGPDTAGIVDSRTRAATYSSAACAGRT